MRTREVMKVCLVLCCTATMVFAQPYSWTGNGLDDDWCNNENWDCLGNCFCFLDDCGYPDDSGDDAGFRTGGPYDVAICAVTVDALDIPVDVDLDSASGSPATIAVDSLTIGGGTIVTLTADVTIKDDDQ